MPREIAAIPQEDTFPKEIKSKPVGMSDVVPSGNQDKGRDRAEEKENREIDERDRKREERRERFCKSSSEAAMFFFVLEERVRNIELKILEARTFSELKSPEIVEKEERDPRSKKIRRTFVSDESLVRYFEKKRRDMQVWMHSEIEHADRLLFNAWIEAAEHLNAMESIVKEWFAERERAIADRISTAGYLDLQKIGGKVKNQPGKRDFFKTQEIKNLRSQVSEENKISLQRSKSNERLLVLWKEREAVVGKEWAAQVVADIATLLQEKLVWAKAEFEKSEGRYTKKQYDNLIAFLESSQHSAESASKEGRYARLSHVLNEMKTARFFEGEDSGNPETMTSNTEDVPDPDTLPFRESVLGFEISVDAILKDTRSDGSRYRIVSIEGNQVKGVLLSRNRNYGGMLSFDRSDPNMTNRFVLDSDEAGDSNEGLVEPSEEKSPQEIIEEKSLEEIFLEYTVDTEMFLDTLVQSADTLLKQLQKDMPKKTLSKSLQREIISEYLKESLQETGVIADEENFHRIIDELVLRIVKDAV